jgi:glycosyltransferase involved in cell wall biosynthesis
MLTYLAKRWSVTIVYLIDRDSENSEDCGCRVAVASEAARNSGLLDLCERARTRLPGRFPRKVAGWLRDRLRDGLEARERRAREDCVSLLRAATGCTAGERDGERTLLSTINGRDALGFLETVRKLRPKVVIFEYVTTLYLHLYARGRRGYSPGLAIVDTHDVMWVRAERYHANGQKHWLSITKAEEQAILGEADGVIAIQQEEAECLQAMVAQEKVLVATHAHPVQMVPEDFPSPIPELLMVAGTADFNIHGLSWLCSEVMPRLLKKVDCRLVLAGRICANAGQACGVGELGDRIEMLGEYEDAVPVYRRGTVVVNPTQVGGGLKIKTVEALCFGKALVTTSCGAQGLAEGADTAFVVADRPEDMAERIAALIRDPDRLQTLKRRAFEFAQDRFPADKAYAALSARLQAVLGAPAR